MLKKLILILTFVTVICVASYLLPNSEVDESVSPTLSRTDTKISSKLEGLMQKSGETFAADGSKSGLQDKSHKNKGKEFSFYDLRAKADSGDVEASRAVGNLVWKCRSIPRSEDEYNLELSQLSATEQPPQANYNVELERIRNCKGVPRDHLMAGTYYKFAADKGNVDAIYEYATILPFLHEIEVDNPDYQLTEKQIETLDLLDRRALEYMLDGAMRGDLRSAVALAAMHQWGYYIHESPDKPRLTLRDANLVEAYSWYYAANIAKGGAGLQAWKESLGGKLEEAGLLAHARQQGQEYYTKYFVEANSTGETK